MTRFGGGNSNFGGDDSGSSAAQFVSIQQQALVLQAQKNGLKPQLPPDVSGLWDFTGLAGGTTSVKNLMRNGPRLNLVTINSEFNSAALDIVGGLGGAAAIATGSQRFIAAQHGLSDGVYLPGNGAANTRASIIGTWLNSTTAYNFSVYVRYTDGSTPTTGTLAYAASPLLIYCFGTTTPTNIQVDATTISGVYRYSCTFTTDTIVRGGTPNYKDYIRLEQSTTVSGHPFTVTGLQVTAGATLYDYERTPYLDFAITGAPTFGTRGTRFSGKSPYAVTPNIPESSMSGPWTIIMAAQIRGVDSANCVTLSMASTANKAVFVQAGTAHQVGLAQSDTSVVGSTSTNIQPPPGRSESSFLALSLVDLPRLNAVNLTTNNAFTGRGAIGVGCFAFASPSYPIDDLEIHYLLFINRAITDLERKQIYLWLAAYLEPKGVYLVNSEPPVLDALPPSGVSPLPPMGWKTWLCGTAFDTSDALVRANAAAIASNGMRAAGYNLIINSAGWEASSGDRRDAAGNILADSTKFPDGIGACVDYVHGLGFDYGGYTSAAIGYDTYGYTGSEGYVEQDAAQFAAWGWDWIQYDVTYRNSSSGSTILTREESIWGSYHVQDLFHTMALALRQTGRNIHLNMGLGANYGSAWGAAMGGDSIRFGADQGNGVLASTYLMNLFTMFDSTIDSVLQATYFTSGFYMDPDELTVGNGLSDAEGRTQFSFYAILMAPLIAGGDATAYTAADIATLTNADVIAVNQDSLCIQGIRVAHDGANNTDVWVRPLADDSWAVLFVNRAATAKSMSVTWADIETAVTTAQGTYASYPSFPFASTPPATAGKNLWTGDAISAATLATGYNAGSIASHACVMIRVYP